jgi:hypothetical protein
VTGIFFLCRVQHLIVTSTPRLIPIAFLTPDVTFPTSALLRPFSAPTLDWQSYNLHSLKTLSQPRFRNTLAHRLVHNTTYSF